MEDQNKANILDETEIEKAKAATPKVAMESDGGTWAVIVKDKETDFIALERTKREYVSRKMAGEPALAADGSGATVEPPANIIASHDPKMPPYTAVTIGGHGKFVLPPESVQLKGWYEPAAHLIISTFPQYKQPAE